MIDKFRFRVGDNDQAHSNAWVIWFHKSDVYIGARTLAGAVKVSLHADGCCHFGLTAEGERNLVQEGRKPATSSRHWNKWGRPITPKTGATHVASVLLPHVGLWRPNENTFENKKTTFQFPPPGEGRTVEVGVFYSRQSPDELESRLAQVATPLLCGHLDNGEYVHIIGRCDKFCDQKIYDAIKKLNNSVLEHTHSSLYQGRTGLSAVFFNDPNKEGVVRAIEVNRINVSSRS